MRLILGLLALVAISFEIYVALHHLREEPVEYTLPYFLGYGLTIAACGFAVVDVWHHYKDVRNERDVLADNLITIGTIVLGIGFVASFFTYITLHLLIVWPIAVFIAGLAFMVVGGLLTATLDYAATAQLDLFTWAREKKEAEERKAAAEKVFREEEEQEAYFRKHPEERPPPMPNPNNSNRNYIS
ncbi:hypothetical protein NL532_10200 [Mesorhizobium sp. C120A]|uniref:hypothetical protein n=1 Tax=unclassified Mesorhizobium TaxID=325217 RepID=UPI0003D05E16|nr:MULTISPECIES: hypothetical protein [unclassified Mesorhizobium]ESZ66629.1 hypothetical protein X728_04005 [Mesorhizobium sp. L103C120A0]WJI46966.1 hypothetical protein NL532_10200 [Mesorhizobium sp. C120A]